MAIQATCNVCGVTDTRPDEAWEYHLGGYGWAHVGCVARVYDRTSDSRQRRQAAEGLLAALELEAAEADRSEARMLKHVIEPGTVNYGEPCELEPDHELPDWTRRAPVWLGVFVFGLFCALGGALVWMLWSAVWAVGGA